MRLSLSGAVFRSWLLYCVLSLHWQQKILWGGGDLWFLAQMSLSLLGLFHSQPLMMLPWEHSKLDSPPWRNTFLTIPRPALLPHYIHTRPSGSQVQFISNLSLFFFISKLLGLVVNEGIFGAHVSLGAVVPCLCSLLTWCAVPSVKLIGYFYTWSLTIRFHC